MCRQSGKLRQAPDPAELASLFPCKLLAARRTGKWVALDLDNSNSLCFHLGMTGKLLWERVAPQQPHKHLKAEVDLGELGKLLFIDPRGFGAIRAMPTSKLDLNVGLEPLDAAFTGQWLFQYAKSSSMPIKNLIMQNHRLAGIGNIYASEALFLAKIHPAKKADTLSKIKAQTLRDAIVQTLREAISLGGSSMRDYVDALGKAGSAQTRHCVYGKANLPCPVCQTPIKKIVLAGRSSFYCPRCQKK